MRLPGLPATPAGIRPRGHAAGCQRAIAIGTAGAAVERLRGAILGGPARHAERRARDRPRRVDSACRVDVRRDGRGHTLPRVGTPCDGAIPAAGDRVDAGALAACLDRALGARLEPVLRHWLRPSIVVIVTDDQPASMLCGQWTRCSASSSASI